MYHVFGMVGTDGRGEAPTLLALALREAYGLTETPPVARTARGKPFFPGSPDLHFNLSHSGGICLCAVGTAPVGVDIEVVKPRRDLDTLAARAFSPAEYRWFTARGGTLEDFYTLWTRKEALAKYTGEGIANVRRICPPLPGKTGPGPALTSWAGEGWRAALCGEGDLPGEIVWT